MPDYNSDKIYARDYLPANVQRRLVELAREGSKEAQDELVVTNLRFIRRVVRQFSRSERYTVDDLMSEGVSGLIKAIYKFDMTKDNNFLSYAVFWIKQSIRAYIRDKSRLIRQPADRQEDMGFVFQTVAPGYAEYEDICNTIEQHTHDSVEDDMFMAEAKRNIDELLNSISNEDAQVIRYRYGLHDEILTYDEISERMNINRKKLKDMAERGMRNLRRNLIAYPNRDNLLQYLYTAQ